MVKVEPFMPECDKCGDDSKELVKCTYCGKHFCDAHYTDHMAWERRHVGLASERGRFWRKTTSQST